MKYQDTHHNEYMEDFITILRELNEINNILNLGKFVGISKQLKQELTDYENSMETLMVLMRYTVIFN